MRVAEERTGLPARELVVDRLRREVHEREVVRPLVGPDVLACDRVDMCLHVAREELLELLVFDVVLGAEHALEVVERELGIDGDEPVDLDHGIDALAAREAVLQGERRRRQPVTEQVLEQELAETAPRLRRAQRLLEALQIVCARQDLLVRAAELAQATLDLTRSLRRALEAPVERRGHRL